MTSLASQHALDLADAAHSPVRAVGRKAHSLGVLMGSGIEVPPGIVLTSPWVERAPDEELRAELATIHARLGGPLAVRSSAADEDTEDRSFAGLYETVLSVDGVDELVDAVRHVVASATSDRLSAYGGAGADIAVLIQRMVPAEAAGVAFTADPVTGERDVSVVSSVSGIGERLVSGEADPDEWEVRDGVVTARRTPEGSLTEDRVRDVAGLAARAAAHFGSPQDIEWAFDGERVLLLQSRPITGLGEVEPIEPTIEPPDDGYWMLDQSHYPTPMSPMAASFYLPALEAGATKAFREWGLLLERLENRVVGWRVYGKLVPLGGGGPTPPWWLMGILARVVPPIRKQAARARKAFESGRAERVIERWWSEWRPEFSAEIRRLHDVPLGDLDDEQLIAHIDETIAFVEHGQQVHFELFPPYMVSVAEMIRFCETGLGWSRAKATELLAGLSEMSSEPARRLRRVAEIARERAGDVLERDDLTLGALRETDSELRQALDGYLDEFGVRATAYDVIAPTIGEQEHLIISSIRSQAEYDPEQVERRHAETREQARAEARRALAGDAGGRSRFEDLLAAVDRAYPVREDNIFFTDNAPLGLVRLAALEIGRRLADRDLFDEPRHVFFLTVDEARTALREGGSLRGRIDRRRGEREWALRHTPPQSFGTDPGPPPDMRAMPEGVRRVMEAIGFFMEHDLSAETGDGLSGTPASAGSYTGTARVVLTEADFHRVTPGDVLVCPITTPAWSVLFGRIGALVTDTGGLLSHSAIVAREHAIPAVVGTGSATGRIENGDTVTVDGTSGTVEITG